MTDLSDPILLSPPHVGDREREAILRAFDSGWIAPAGVELDLFEAELADACGAPAAAALSSGTASLHLALVLAGVVPGDEVIVQSATFAASAFAVVHAGARPVFIDSESGTWCMDPELLLDFLKLRSESGSLPRAVVPVDLYGTTADYAQLRSVCDRFEVALVRDAAESLGSLGETGRVGESGCLTVLSFNGNKIITASSGGALLGSPEQAERARHLGSQAREPFLHYEHESIGYNYRLSNLLAALGRAQLAQLDERVDKRAKVAAQYRSLLPELEWCPHSTTPHPNHWLTVGLLPSGDPLEICERLHGEGVQARPAWKPMHRQPIFADSEFVFGAGVADDLFNRGVCLPSGSAMTEDQVRRVAEQLRTIAGL